MKEEHQLRYSTADEHDLTGPRHRLARPCSTDHVYARFCYLRHFLSPFGNVGQLIRSFLPFRSAPRRVKTVRRHLLDLLHFPFPQTRELTLIMSSGTIAASDATWGGAPFIGHPDFVFCHED